MVGLSLYEKYETGLILKKWWLKIPSQSKLSQAVMLSGPAL
jgi:hypothetical protein